MWYWTEKVHSRTFEDDGIVLKLDYNDVCITGYIYYISHQITQLHWVNFMYRNYTSIKLYAKKLQNNMENNNATVYVKSAQSKEHRRGENKRLA